MALTACGIKIAINGSETDVDVENDSASWTTKVGNVRVTTGGGSWWRDGKPGVCNLDMMLPLHLASKVRTVTIGVTLIPSTASTMPSGTIGAGSANAYRIIFHGDVQSVKGTPTNQTADIVQFDAVSEMSGLLNRKARTAAAPNTGIRDLLGDIETAHSLTMSGDAYFPVAAEYANLDRPAQKANTNGAWIRTALAGSGINMSEDWQTSITAPELMWRPDFQDPDYYATLTTARMWTWQAGYPWLYSYPDVGLQYEDFVARVNVEGENSGGTQVYGYGGLANGTIRATVGNRDVTLSTWMDNTTDCQTYARRLIAYQGQPNYLKLNQFTLNTEHLYRVMQADDTAGKTIDPEVEIFTAAAGMPGDTVTRRYDSSVGVGFGDGHDFYRDWPSNAPDGGDLYDTLDPLWNPEMAYTPGVEYADTHIIRAFTRQFTPTGGWDVTYGVEPWTDLIRGADVSYYGNGTY